MPLTQFLPFQNDSQSLNLGEFTVENQGEQVNLYGSMTLTIDKQSLENAKALQRILNQAIAYLENHNAAQQDEHTTLEQQQGNVTEVANPFS